MKRLLAEDNYLVIKSNLKKLKDMDINLKCKNRGEL